MESRDPIATSKAIQRRTGKTFHVATRLLPERVRRATYVLYAFFRVADEVVDDPDGPPPEEQRRELDRIRAAALGERDDGDPVLSAFRAVRERYDIPDAEVEAFIDSMAMDVTKSRYDTYDDLEGYLRGSAVSVGYMMLAVIGSDDPEAARPHARALGEAFQLTNFLRDVREDIVDYDRIYLPRETLARYGVPERDIEDLRFSDGFAAVMRAELRRTERLYRRGVAGIRYLSEDCQFPVLAAAVLYADHHRLIREQGYDVLSSRPSLSLARRIGLVGRTWWHWRRDRDPEAVFYRVSAVGERGVDAEPEPGSEPEPTATGCRITRWGRRPIRHVAGLVRSIPPEPWR